MFRLIRARCDRETQIGIILLVCSTLFTAYLVEVGLILYPVYGQKAYLSLRYDFDNRSIYDFISDNRNSDVELNRIFTGYNLLARKNTPDNSGSDHLWPLGGISNIGIVPGNENGFFPVARNDGRGFRNPLTVYDDSIDVMAGDSFAYGCCVEDDMTVSGRLGVGGYGALNLGICGSGPVFQYAVIREYAEPLLPRYVMWLFYGGNDRGDVEFESKLPVLRKYLEEDYFQDLIGTDQFEIDELLRGGLQGGL